MSLTYLEMTQNQKKDGMPNSIVILIGQKYNNFV